MNAAKIARALGGARSGRGWMAHCPAHDDERPSLSITDNDGKVLLHCYAGCSQEGVIAALKTRGLWGNNGQGRASIIETYNYTDESRNLLYQVCHYEPKGFRQRRPDGNGGWVWNLKGTRRVLYKLPDVQAAVKSNRPVFIVEGEKDADRLSVEGFFTGSTNCGGAGKWRPEYNESLRGAQVVIIPDNDEPGRKHAHKVAKNLQGIAASVKVVELPDLPEKGDISDWFDKGHDSTELIELVKNTPEWKPSTILKNFSVKTNDPILRLESEGELEDAERFKAFYGDDVRWCPDLKEWFIWDGKRYHRDDAERALGLVQNMVREMYKVGAGIDEKSLRVKYIDHARKLESLNRLRHTLELAKPMVAIQPERFDTDPWLFNVENVTLDLRTCEFREHRKDDMITILSPVKYDPDAASDVWEAFLQRILPDDELCIFVQKAAGYTMTGDTGEEKLFFAYGPPATGKSTFLSAIKSVLGEYASQADFEIFLQRKNLGGGPRPEIADLKGKRMVISLEVEEGRRIAEALVCQLTGGDNVRARHLYSSSFEFLPHFKLWLAANSRPRVTGDNSGLWRRILQLPFDQVIPEEEQDPAIKQQLRDPEVSGSAILNWLLEGLEKYWQEGLRPPKAVMSLTEEYRQSQNPLRDFIEECCILGDSEMVGKGELYEKYRHWHEDSGESKFYMKGKRQFGDRIRNLPGVDEGQNRNFRFWIGIGLMESDICDK